MNLETYAKKWNPIGYNQLISQSVAGFTVEKGAEGAFAKGTDYPLLISTTGAWRAVMGKLAWYWVNYNNPAFGALRKVAWDKSGERIVQAEPGTAACQGIDETDAIPDRQKPTFAYHATQFKQVMTPYQVTRKMAKAAQLGDDSLKPEDMRAWALKHNALEMGKMVLENVQYTAANAAADWGGKKGFEALARIISCDEEEDDAGGTHAYNFDPWKKYESTAGGTQWSRESLTTWDSVVVHGDGTLANQSCTANLKTGHATLNTGAIDALIDYTQKAGANPRNQFFVTSFDTARRWAQLVSPKQRFENYERISVTVNGIQSVEGTRAGFRVATYDDIPIIRDQNCPKDYADAELSQIFLIDSETLFFKVATPTFLMAPDEAESYLALDKPVQDQWFLTEGELWCTNPKTQGKMVAIK